MVNSKLAEGNAIFQSMHVITIYSVKSSKR